jgi:hypothetical protein
VLAGRVGAGEWKNEREREEQGGEKERMKREKERKLVNIKTKRTRQYPRGFRVGGWEKERERKEEGERGKKDSFSLSFFFLFTKFPS